MQRREAQYETSIARWQRSTICEQTTDQSMDQHTESGWKHDATPGEKSVK